MGWDSNPRDPSQGLPVFKTGAFNRSATHPACDISALANQQRRRFTAWFTHIRGSMYSV
ncbi:hypothetical protein DF3PA_130038 [Candidatus Defluviicoccus seviourii]|uniref:Uncharacterized protein n=2 Tax=root TaxID=1 RepID=A0A564WAM4_9PROT|nr:hypothetical protein DF3PB_70017 [uncultured Defluviicoccus sp.]VUX45540.1 hypothetical protein DF3PA_130038 [Candidatus Defluviicoccus seviourii]